MLQLAIHNINLKKWYKIVKTLKPPNSIIQGIQIIGFTLCKLIIYTA
jgi:hypothetical protein